MCSSALFLGREQMDARRKWLESDVVCSWVRHLHSRPVCIMQGTAQATSPKVMQLKVGALSVQHEVALEISRRSLNCLHYRNCSIKSLNSGLGCLYYLEYVAWGRDGCPFDGIEL